MRVASDSYVILYICTYYLNLSGNLSIMGTFYQSSYINPHICPLFKGLTFCCRYLANIHTFCFIILYYTQDKVVVDSGNMQTAIWVLYVILNLLLRKNLLGSKRKANNHYFAFILQDLQVGKQFATANSLFNISISLCKNHIIELLSFIIAFICEFHFFDLQIIFVVKFQLVLFSFSRKLTCTALV